MSLFNRKPKQSTDPNPNPAANIVELPPRWIDDAIDLFRDDRFGLGMTNYQADRARAILGSLEYEPVNVSIITTPAKSYIGICFRIHPREMDLVIPWKSIPRIIRREYGRAIDDSLIRDPNVRQLREALAWVDNGYLNRGEE